jgi:hypothetical protein
LPRDFCGARIIRIAHHHVIAAGETAEQDTSGRRHAGSEGYAGFRLLQRRQLFLKLIVRRVGPSSVDVGSVAFELVRREADFLLDSKCTGHHEIGRRRAARRIVMFAGVNRRSPDALSGWVDTH